MKTAINIILLCLIYSSISAQNVAPTWTGYYSGNGDNSDKFNKIIADGSGNFIAVGYTVEVGNYKDFLIVKFNDNGDTLWTRTKNGLNSGDDEAISVGVDNLGNVFVTGYVDGGNSNLDICTIKYGPSGTTLWEAIWNSPAYLDDYPLDLKVDQSGNCFIGGITIPDTSNNSSDYISLKYSSGGILDWSSEFTNISVPHGRDELAAIALDSIGNLFVTGRSSNAVSGGNDDFATIKYDAISGSQLWIQIYNSGNNDRGNCIVVDHSQNVIVTGRSSNGSDDDFRTIKYSNSGVLQWTKLYNSPTSKNDRPSSINVDNNNNVIVVGQSGSSSVYYDFETVKYSSTGTQQWAVRIGNVSSQDDIPSCVAVDSLGNIFISGKSDQNPDPLHTDYDFMTLEYSPSGGILWGPMYLAGTLTGGDDIPYSCAISNGNLFVVGYNENINVQKDAAIAKYEMGTGNLIFQKSFNGIGDYRESAQAIVVDNNQNSYVAGYTFGLATNLNACIERFDPSGNLFCSYTYSGAKSDDDEFVDIAIDQSQMIYAAGYTKVSNQKSNMLLVKWNPATCDTVWTRTYDGIRQTDRAVSITIDLSNNIYLTGYSDVDPNDTINSYNIVTMKFDSNGNRQWIQNYNGTANSKDVPAKIILDNSGNVIVAGKSANIHDDDFIILKYDQATGSPLWTNPAIWSSQYSNDDQVNDVVVDSFNNIFVCGHAQAASGSNPPQDEILLKYDSNGVYVNGTFYLGDDKDEAVKIAINSDNNVYTVFKTDVDPSSGIHNFDYQLRKFDNNLTEVWPQPAEFNGSFNSDDVPSSITLDDQGNILITGTSIVGMNGNLKNSDWLTVGFDSLGNQLFLADYDGPNSADDAPNAMIYHNNCLWIAGHSTGLNYNQKDVAVNNYCNLPVSIKALNEIQSAIVYPNPFNTETVISFNNYSKVSKTVFSVIDVLGNIVGKEIEMTNPSLVFEKGDLKPGVYQYKISSGTTILAQGALVIY